MKNTSKIYKIKTRLPKTMKLGTKRRITYYNVSTWQNNYIALIKW